MALDDRLLIGKPVIVYAPYMGRIGIYQVELQGYGLRTVLLGTM